MILICLGDYRIVSQVCYELVTSVTDIMQLM